MARKPTFTRKTAFPRLRVLFVLGVACLTALSLVTTALAANTSNFSQTINTGTLTTDIRDASRVTVASPSVAFSTITFGFDCQASTGTFGTNTQRIYVDNGDAADNGWTLTLAATGGATSTWSDGGSNTYDFNDPTGSGCTDGGDADSKGGQMTVNPSVGTLTTDCGSCNTTGISLGSSTAFNQGTTDSITLITAGSTSSDIGRWYLTGVAASQQVPAEQTPASYTLNMTLTVTAS